MPCLCAKIPRIQLTADAHNIMVKMFRTVIMAMNFLCCIMYIMISHKIHRCHQQIVFYDFVVKMLQYVTRCSEAFRINLAETGERIRILILRSDCGKLES